MFIKAVFTNTDGDVWLNTAFIKRFEKREQGKIWLAVDSDNDVYRVSGDELKRLLKKQAGC